MDGTRIPVEARTRSLAHWALYIAVGLPTLAALLAGMVIRVVGRGQGATFAGLLTWVVLIGVIQFAILVVGRAQYLSGVPMRTVGPPRPPRCDVGMFHHDRR